MILWSDFAIAQLFTVSPRHIVCLWIIVNLHIKFVIQIFILLY